MYLFRQMVGQRPNINADKTWPDVGINRLKLGLFWDVLSI